MTDDAIARVHYFSRQYLRTQEFVDEQAYHVAMRRRHNVAHHRWGIVSGLELMEEEGIFYLLAGTAVDGYGRELVLPERQPLDGGAFDDKDSDVLDVWLVYDRIGAEPTPEGYAGCANGDGGSFYRWQERPIVRLEAPDPSFEDRRQPKEVPEGDLDFGPSRTPPDDPQSEWPVFMGQIVRERTDPTQPFACRVDLWDRPYAGLVGEGVSAPSGRARVQIGAEERDDTRRFAVFVPEVDAQVPRLEIDDQGRLDVRGKTTMYGGLTMAGGAIAFRAGRAQSAQPWKVYRQGPTPGDATAPDQLRIEMEGGGNGRNQVAIGYWSDDEKKFVECLVVDDNCVVTVRGNLVVEGRLEAQGGIAPVAFTAEARHFLTGSTMAGISGAGVLAGSVGPVAGAPFGRIGRPLSGEGGPVMAARMMRAAPETLPALAGRLVADNAARDALIQALAANPTFLAETMDKLAQAAAGSEAAMGRAVAAVVETDAGRQRLAERLSADREQFSATLRAMGLADELIGTVMAALGE